MGDPFEATTVGNRPRGAALVAALVTAAALAVVVLGKLLGWWP